MKDEYIDYAEDYGIFKTEKVGEIEFYVAEKIDVQGPEYIFGVVDRQFDDLGVISYRIDKKSKNYFEIMDTFYDAVHKQFKQVRREEAVKPAGKINQHDCLSIYNFKTLKGKVIALRTDRLQREYRSTAHQLYIADGGSGCSPSETGSALFARSLYTGEEALIQKHDVMGVMKEEKMPEWAKNKAALMKQKRKQ